MATEIGAGAFLTSATPRLPRTFIDSNVLVYAEDSGYPAKRQKAQELVVQHRRNRTGVISLQVLGEFYHVVTRRLKLDAAVARAQAEFHSRFDLVEPTLADTFGAIDLHRLYGFSYWDSLVVRCAIVSGCKVLVSEDMQHGQIVDGVRIVNPFL